MNRWPHKLLFLIWFAIEMLAARDDPPSLTDPVFARWGEE